MVQCLGDLIYDYSSRLDQEDLWTPPIGSVLFLSGSVGLIHFEYHLLSGDHISRLFTTFDP